MGHFQPRQRRLASGLMSAAGLIAAVRSTDAGSSVSAIRRPEQVQQRAPLFDYFIAARHPALAYFCSMIFSESRYPLFEISL
jgi:hypothetical protein